MLNGYIAFLKKSKQGANEPGEIHSIRDDFVPYPAEPFESSLDVKETDL